jgi:hypothetical protein
MKDLIEALTIFLKYKDRPYPTGCEHDVLYVYGITKDEVSAEDQARLEELGFHWDAHDDNWQSFKYGSA